MKQILQNLKTGKTEFVDVPCPAVKTEHLIIKSQISLISPGTERMLVEFSKGGLLAKAKSQPDKVKQVLDKIRTDGLMPTLETVFKRLDEPLPLGYCNVGTVVQAESSKLKVESLKVGDRVVSNGPHAEVVCVPENLCAKIPDNVSDEQASFTVLGAIGLQGIRLAEPTLGEKFVVFGAGLIGLLTVQLLRASGCDVLTVDLIEERLALARTWGAEICNAGNGDPVAAANAWTEGVGVDGVIITASAKTDGIVHQAAEMCRKRGRIVLVGVVRLNLQRADFYEKELRFQVSCSYGPGRYDENYEQKGLDYPIGYVRWTEQRNFEAVLAMMATGRLDVEPLITDRVAFEEAEKAYAKISGDASVLGVILEYQRTEDGGPRTEDGGRKAEDKGQTTDGRWQRTVKVSAARTDKELAPEKVVVAMIGAGNFAKMTMGPALAKTGARLKYVSARTNGAAAAHIARKYRFENATTDLDAIWNDSDVDTVIITTGHNSHAALVCRALEAGKHVFVEKPLCLNLNELAEIQAAQSSKLKAERISANSDLRTPSSVFCHLMVGFNRRFSPHVNKIKELLKSRGEPLAMNFTVNAGVIPKDVWVHDPEVGGGRIIGEACHFMDLLGHICGSRIVSVTSAQMGKGVAVKEDKMSIVLSFEDGSIGTVNYFGNGSKSYPKEMLEVFSGGRVLRLNNFRKLEGFGFKGFRKFKTRKMDKGHQVQFNAFVEQVEKGGEALIAFDEIVNVTLASFAAVTSANERRMIHLGEEYDWLQMNAHP
jgi:predicted dehydrogenase/threonine dehydrogenase-like Zn-dependent dehydrogenase